VNIEQEYEGGLLMYLAVEKHAMKVGSQHCYSLVVDLGRVAGLAETPDHVLYSFYHLHTIDMRNTTNN
jgi:hypothetical protein